MQWLLKLCIEWIQKQGYALESWVEAKAYATMAWVTAQGYALESWVIESYTAYNVTGSLIPDATCNYYKAGSYNGKPYYQRDDGAFYIWWDGSNAWILGEELGDYELAFWYRTDPDMFGEYTAEWPAQGTATIAEGRKYLCNGFVDRGDPSRWDFVTGNFIKDGAWHDRDLSGIIPKKAKAVLFLFRFRCSAILLEANFRKDGNANSLNVSRLVTQVADVYFIADFVCPVSEDGKIEYMLPATGVTSAYFVVKGWFF